MSPAKSITIDEIELARFFLAVALLLGSAQVFGAVFQRWKLPRVIGEISGGLVLGPSLLGHFWPEAYAWVFAGFQGEGKLLAAMSWLGLTLLMFVSGFEIQKSIDRQDRRTIGALLLGGTVLPFLAGWVAPMAMDFSSLAGPKANPLALQMVVGVAVAVTSIPVIAKVFIDLNVLHTRFAKIVIATATMEDVILWAGFGAVAGTVHTGEASVGGVVWSLAVSLVFLVAGLLILPKLAGRLGSSVGVAPRKPGNSGQALLICLAGAIVAGALSVNIVFGALLAGIIVGAIPTRELDDAKAHIKDVSLGFFVPVYFAVVGLKLDLVHHFAIAALLAFLAFATVFKVAGTFFAARLTGQDRLSSTNFAVAMNARGGPGIVLATVSFDLGIINEEFFIILVMTSMITALLAGWWFRLVLARGGTLMSEPIAAEPRLRPGPAVVPTPAAAGVRGDDG